jgi:hypothetical protein
MSTLAERLKKRRREEQDTNHYSASSRWYDALNKAISAIEGAESATDPIDRFTKAYWAADGLSQLHAERGESDFIAFQRWMGDLKSQPDVTQHFNPARNLIPLNSFREAVTKSRKTLLGREGDQELEAWNKNSTPEKACSYFFTICRAIRNRLFHADLNLNSASIRKTLAVAGDCLLPVVAAATLRSIEWPPAGTTGKAPPYRFFLYPFLKNSDGFFSDYYLERLFPDKELGAFAEDLSKEAFKQLAKQFNAKAQDMQTTDGDATHSNWLEPVLFSVLGINALSGVRVVTEDAVFQPNLVLPRAGASGHKAGTELKGKDAGKSLSCMIWTLPWRISLDSVATEPPFTSLPITEVVHRALAASEVPWAIITNGRQLRLLSRVSSHKPRCFLEADLVALIDRRTDAQAGRAFRFLLGLFSGRCFTEVDAAGQSLLDRVAEGSDRHGKEIGDELKANVFSALQELGEGFLDYLRANPTATSEWRDRRSPGMSHEKFLTSDVLLDDIYHESLSLMYRLLFLFYAESRELLPLDNELYQTYSLESIRDDVHSVQDDPDPKRFYAKGNSDLWARLKELFGFLDKGWGKIIPPYNGGLFDPEKHEFLERFAVGDYYLARAIDLLSRTKPRIGQNRGEGRKKVTYRDLDVRHLGSIYEGILEYTARIADQEYVILRDGSGSSATEEYVAVADLKNDQHGQFTAWKAAVEENPENPRPPRGCKVTGNVESGQYYLAFGGRESKRKSSGSYYTPDYIVQYIVESALGPLVRGECRPKPEAMPDELKAIGRKDLASKAGPLTSKEILDLSVVDPAMGSGHFLVAATEFLARAYRDALLREGQSISEGTADLDFVRAKRLIAERCVHGLDANPMAVELAKLSMWLFTMDPGRPLSFLDHNLRCGDALVNARISDLIALPSFDRAGRVKQGEASKGSNLFESAFQTRVSVMVSDLMGIEGKETLTTADIHDKKTLDAAVHQVREPFLNMLTLWMGTFFGYGAPNYLTLLTNIEAATSCSVPVLPKRATSWQLEFPALFFDSNGLPLADGGFDAVLANPPYVFARETLSDEEKSWYAYRFGRTSKDKPNLYVMFLDLAVELTKKNARIGFIIPNSVLAVESTEPLRDLLLTAAPPQRCVVCLYPVFEGVGVEPVVMCLGKGVNSLVCECKVQLSEEDFGRHSYCVSIERWARLPGKQFAMFTPESVAEVLDSLASRCTALSNVTSVKAALQAYEAGKGTPAQTADDVRNHIFDRDHKDSPQTYRYLEGADVGRFRISWSGSWLKYGPWLSQPRELSTFAEARVLVREVTGRFPRMLIAAPTEELFLNNKSIVNILCNIDSRYSANVVAGILNSKLGSFIFKHSGVKANRGLFPKVVIGDLQGFFVPSAPNLETLKQIERAVREMRELPQAGGTKADDLQAKIDSLAYSLYDLTHDQIAVVEAEIEVSVNAAD